MPSRRGTRPGASLARLALDGSVVDNAAVAGEVSELMQALYQGDSGRADRLLAERTELDVFEAAAFGRVDRLRELLDDDAEEANALAPDGFTALHFAAFFGQPEAARLLLERGAGPGATARNDMRVQPLHSAAAADHTEIARMLLDAGADPNESQEGGFVPLHAAAQNGNAELVDLLLAHGADPTLATGDGRTSAQIAREAGHEPLAELLPG
jgi:ankyrin repeat protein